MDNVKQLQGPARFVGLKMPDEMPARAGASRQSYHCRDLSFGLLHSILAEVRGAEFDQTTYQTRRMRLADCNQRDFFGTAAATPRRGFDACLDVREAGGKTLRVNICHRGNQIETQS
jgi:hypothetical protein